MSPPSDRAPHATLRKFGYPETLIHEGEHWALLVRPAQPTLGSLILCARGEETSYGALPAAAMIEQGELVTRLERMLKSLTSFDKLNYLMLMMVDPHVHFHVIPRYASERRFGDNLYRDSGWPGVPDLAKAIPADVTLIEACRNLWR